MAFPDRQIMLLVLAAVKVVTANWLSHTANVMSPNGRPSPEDPEAKPSHGHWQLPFKQSQLVRLCKRGDPTEWKLRHSLHKTVSNS